MENEIIVLENDEIFAETEVVEVKEFFDKKQTKKKIKYLSENEFLHLKRILDETENLSSQENF